MRQRRWSAVWLLFATRLLAVPVTVHVTDPAGTPLPGILVSDSDRLLPTDAGGQATFDVLGADDEVRRVFAVVPGDRRPVGPWHALVTGASEVSFQLRAAPDPGETVFYVTGDLAAGAEAESVGRQLRDLAATGEPRFVAVLGDLTATGADEQFRGLLSGLAGAAAPFVCAFGDRDGGLGRRSVSAFERLVAPAWYAFLAGGCCYVVLATEPGVLTGLQQARQLRWLQRLAATVPAKYEFVVLAHVPPAATELETIRQQHRLRACCYGHWPENSLWYHGTTPMIATGPWRGEQWGRGTGAWRRVAIGPTALTAQVTRPELTRRDVTLPQATVPFSAASTAGCVPPLAQRWRIDTRSLPEATPAYADYRVYLGLPDDSLPGEPAVACYAATSGSELWRRPTLGSVRGPLSVGGGRVFALTHLNVAYAFDAASGEVLWQRPLTPAPPGRHRNTRTAPLLLGERVLFQVGGGPLVALAAASGQPAGSATPEDAFYAGPLLVGQSLVVPTLNGLVGLDLFSLNRRWRTVGLSLPRHGGVATDGASAYVLGDELAAVDLSTGHVRWRRAWPGSGQRLGAPAVADGVVYTPGARPRALRAGTGVPLWGGEPDGGPVSATPVLDGELVWSVGDDGRLSAWQRRDGERVWQVDLGAPLQTAPRLAGNALFVVDATGQLTCLVSQP